MFRIGEFSKLSQVSIRMLRYYDEQGLLHPHKVDQEAGYRIYHVNQLLKVQKIILLRNMKFSTAEIKELIAEEVTDEHFQQRLKEKYAQIEQEIAEEQRRLFYLSKTLEKMENPDEKDFHVIFRELPSEPIVSLRKRIHSYYHEGPLWQEFIELLESETLEYQKQAPDNFTIFHDEGYREEDVEIEICLKLKETAEVKEPLTCYQIEKIPLAASIFILGPYENIKEAYFYFANWLSENEEYEMLKPTRQVSHRGPETGSKPEDYLIEIQIPIKKIS
ncbi:MerR family transcriptional regulator [Enterococcus sp. CWB-B31]|uniref:MerR family transcriptional regulator n=1 Tax=Enterococcus sp. CWB-B31 TaxID=2885159 RepID=UPI001E5F1AE1|nr:MerR family transcriptional regulator [Enterococcus sp. CWB-B31]MCB5954507.1 MerR family transcriptional regulator [Enterococcus sp. CWB-B31]